MNDLLREIHTEEYIKENLSAIEKNLLDLYGEQKGRKNYNYVLEAAQRYLESLSPADIEHYSSFDKNAPYEHLRGKIFAICYPDNIYTGSEVTLKTLSRVLESYFPGINGIHILPERVMSHYDVFPQDFFEFLDIESSVDLVDFLKSEGLLDDPGTPTEKYGILRGSAAEELVRTWLDKRKYAGSF